MSPWLRRIVWVLKVGLPMGKALGTAFDRLDGDIFSNELDAMGEILGELPEITTIDAESGAQLNSQPMQQLEGSALEALHAFLKEHKKPWQGLSPVVTDNGQILWLCDHHRKEYESPLITVVY